MKMKFHSCVCGSNEQACPPDPWRQSMNKSSLFTTGEFAKVCNTTKDTLFHYDEVGVLTPEVTHENGYRYYTLKQIYLFNLIRTLKDCGASLQEIKHFMSIDSPSEIKDFIGERKLALKEQIATLNQALGFLEQTDRSTDYLSEDKSYYYETPRIVEREEKYLISTAAAKDIRLNSHQTAEILRDHFSYCDSTLKINKFPVGRIIKKNTLFSGELFHSYVFSITPVKYDDERAMVKPAGRYVHLFHHGNYDTIGYSYQKILDFISKNHLSIIGDAYELEANNFMMEKDRQNQIIGIMILVN